MSRIEKPKFFGIVLVVIVGIASPRAHAMDSQVYQIRTVTDDGEIHCSSTLIKLDSGKCSLVTNDHCVPIDETDQVFEVSPAALVAPNLHPDTELQVLKRSEALDLAELSLSPDAQVDCVNLTPPSVLDEAEVVGKKELDVRSVGYVEGVYTESYSDDLPWYGGSSYSDVSLYRHGPLPSEIFYQFDRLDVIPGMSGGVVTEREGATIGINSQLIPFQKVAFVIPIQEIFNFLKNGGPDSSGNSSDILTEAHAASGAAYIPSSSESAESNSHADSGANSHGNGGANSHGNGGANSHGNGGANSHGNGGANSHGNGGVGIVDTNFNPADPLYLFREPDEGVPIEPGSDTILLGIDGKQIDGVDDYYIKYWPVKDQGKHTLVTRNANDYPGVSIRKNILSRLDGMFRGGGSNTSFQSNEHALLNYDAAQVEGFKEWLVGSTLTEVDVDSKANQIHMYFWMHDIAPPGLPIAIHEPAWVLTLNVQMSPDFKTITLIPDKGGTGVTCDNKNYLKLICRAQGTEFSLSVNQEKSAGKQLTYRTTYVRSGAKVPVVDYRYGTTTQEADMNKARKFAKEMAKQEEGIIPINQ